MNTRIFSLVAICLLFVGCSKDFLDKPLDERSVIPTELSEFQALLDNSSYLNAKMPQLGELSVDDFYASDAVWQATVPAFVKNAYVWAADLYEGDKTTTAIVEQWSFPYRMVFYANVVLDGLPKVEDGNNPVEWNNVKGQALFFRAYAFYLVAQHFAKTYDKQTASSDLGIPLRLSSGIEAVSERANLQETYDQILSDLQLSSSLLPTTAVAKTRPSKSASFAMLARVYLIMDDYAKAAQYADSALKYNNALLNYNNAPVNSVNMYPIPRFNDEVLFHTVMSTGTFINGSRITDSLLYRSYEANDLRKTIYFRIITAGPSYRGSYDGTNAFFCGIANDEVYLIKAECNARLGQTGIALQTLNDLLSKRWKTGTFVQFTANTAEEALVLILNERRKELVNRGIRWSDLRRLNKDTRFAKTLKRIINNNQTYQLLPNDLRYVFPIPDKILEFSTMPQNNRK